MPGRPRLTAEDLMARIAGYCQRYRVAPSADGLPPFPAGRRETQQHREWMVVYKAHSRLARRGRGQCERCSSPAANGSVFCDEHRAASADRTTPVERRHELLRAQKGRCPICGEPIDLGGGFAHGDGPERLRAVLHPRCHDLVRLAGAAGPKVLDRLRAYLWPRTPQR